MNMLEIPVVAVKQKKGGPQKTVYLANHQDSQRTITTFDIPAGHAYDIPKGWEEISKEYASSLLSIDGYMSVKPKISR